jgi:hypothetical protein
MAMTISNITTTKPNDELHSAFEGKSAGVDVQVDTSIESLTTILSQAAHVASIVST